MQNNKILFNFGQIFCTKSINYRTKQNYKFNNEIINCFERHIKGDFGEICEEDKKANLRDIENDNGHILSKYKTSEGEIYIDTRYELFDYKENKPNFKKITMIMFCDEY